MEQSRKKEQYPNNMKFSVFDVHLRNEIVRKNPLDRQNISCHKSLHLSTEGNLLDSKTNWNQLEVCCGLLWFIAPPVLPS